MDIKINKQFPEGFLFGASTSSFQVEGAWRENDRGETVQDHIKRSNNITDFSVASDHYHRYEEDIALWKELGLKAYRFSISWARIMPDGKNINQAGIDFYNKLLNSITEAGIEPVVTIYHFEYPQALVNEFGGWFSRKSIESYVQFTSVLFNLFGDRVKYWLTINEQDHVIKFRERLGISKHSLGLEVEKQLHQANYHMCVATAKVIKLAKEKIKDVKIGPAINPMPAFPKTSHPEDVLAAKMYEELSHYYILDLHCKGKFSPVYWTYMENRGTTPVTTEEDLQLMADNPPNYLGINYYMNQTVERSSKKGFEIRGEGVFVAEEVGIYKLAENPEIKKSQWGWNICSEGLLISLIDLYNRYELPMLITENGLGAYDELVDGKIHDDYRIEYLQEHLAEIKKVLSMGIPIIGYCAWSAIDLVSGREGMDKRYGFVYVNRTNDDLKDLKRIKKDSFYWYQNVIETNGENL